MRKEIRSIGVLSAGKIGCLWGALLTAILGCVLIFLPMVALPGLLASAAPDQTSGLDVFGGGVVAAIVAYVGAVVLEAVSLAIVFALGALIYNLVAKMAGGLTIETDD